MVIALSQGTATITVTTVDGGDTARCSVTVSDNVGIVDIQKSNTVSVYPNPVEDYLFIDTQGQTIDRIQIINILGTLLLDKQKVSNTVDVLTLPKGVHVLNNRNERRQVSNPLYQTIVEG